MVVSVVVLLLWSKFVLLVLSLVGIGGSSWKSSRIARGMMPGIFISLVASLTRMPISCGRPTEARTRRSCARDHRPARPRG